MERATENLYDYEMDRFQLIRPDGWEVRLTRTKKNPWNIFLDVWKPEEAIGTEKMSPALALDQIRSIAKTMLEEADAIETEWNALSPEIQTEWRKKMGLE